MNEICKNCGDKIQISIFKGGDWCSDDCRKALKKIADSQEELRNRDVDE